MYGFPTPPKKKLKWSELKQQGLCTKCGVRVATGLRKILCDVCREALKREHDQGAEAVPYYDKDKKNHNGERG